jgi:hypothetical protein
MLAFAIDNQAPATIVLISGDRDFTYAVSILRLRHYRVVIVAPPIIHVSLKLQASILVDWNCDILEKIEADPELVKKSSSCTNEGDSPQFINKSEPDRKMPPTRIPPSMTSRSAELVEDVEHVHPNAPLIVERDSDTPQYGPRNSPRVHKMFQGHADVSGASVPDTKVQSFTQNGGFSSTHCSSFQKRFSGESTVPITAGCPGSVLSRLNTPLSALVSAPGQVEYIPRMFQQTRVVSGRTSLSTVNPKLEFGTSSSRRPSVFSSPSHQADTPGNCGSWSDSHLVPKSSTMTPVPKAKSLHFGIVEKGGGGGSASSSLSSEVPTASTSFIESPDIDLGSPDNIAYLKSKSSSMSSSSGGFSLVTSTTVEAHPGIVEMPHLASKSDLDYSETTAISLPTSPEILAASRGTDELLASAPSVGEVQTKQNSASSTSASASARIPPTNHESVMSDCGKTATRLPWMNATQTFRILVEQLELQQERGVSRPSPSVVAEKIMKQDVLACQRAGVHTFRQYIALALEAGIVIAGGAGGMDWISLHPALQSLPSLPSRAIESLHPQSSTNETDNTAGIVLDQAARECGASISIAECTGSTCQPTAFSPAETESHITTNISSESVSTIASTDGPLPETSVTDPIRMIGETDTNSTPFPLRSVPSHFEVLVRVLQEQRANGLSRPSRSSIAIELVKQDLLVYMRAGVSRFKDYIALAVEARVVMIGGVAGDAWISLPLEETLTVTSQGIVPPLPGTCTSAQKFQVLIEQLRKSRSDGVERPLRSVIGQRLVSYSKAVYKDAGFEGFKDYITAAEIAGIVRLGGVSGSAWISLCSVCMTK